MVNVVEFARDRGWRIVAAVLLVAAGVYALQHSGVAGKKVSEMVAPAAGAAQVDYFLKIEGIEGESSDDKHKGEIEVESWSWGESQPGLEQADRAAAGTGGGAGKAKLNDFHFVMKSSKASPQLMAAAAKGKHFQNAILTVRKAGQGQQEYIKVKLEEVMVGSYQIAGDSGLPTDQISLNFGKVELSYLPQRADGSLDTAITGMFARINRAE